MNTTKTNTAPLHYYRTDTRPRRGDIIATCRMGQCRVIRITPDRMLYVRNIITKEASFEYAEECDLIQRRATPEKDANRTTMSPTPQFELVREQPWDKPVWRLRHIPTGDYLPVHAFTYRRRRDAQALRDALHASGITFSTFADLQARPDDYKAMVAVLQQHQN